MHPILEEALAKGFVQLPDIEADTLAFAQSTPVAVTGSVQDQTGAVLAAATVELVNASGAIVQATVANEAGVFRLRAQIGFTVAKAIHRCLFPTALIHAFDGEEIEATLFQPLRDPGENGREVADIDHRVGGQDEIITVPGFRKHRLDVLTSHRYGRPRLHRFFLRRDLALDRRRFLRCGDLGLRDYRGEVCLGDRTLYFDTRPFWSSLSVRADDCRRCWPAPVGQTARISRPLTAARRPSDDEVLALIRS